MTTSDLSEFFQANNNLQKFEQAYQLLHDCFSHAAKRLYTDLTAVMHELADDSKGRWGFWEYLDAKHQFIGLTPTEKRLKQDPFLHVAGLKGAFLSQHSWAGVWSEKPETPSAGRVITACRKILGAESLKVVPEYPYWVRIPGWPNASMDADDFSVAGLEGLLKDPDELPAWIRTKFAAVLKSARV